MMVPTLLGSQGSRLRVPTPQNRPSAAGENEPATFARQGSADAAEPPANGAAPAVALHPPPVRERLLTELLRLQVRREHSPAELLQRMRQRGYDPIEIHGALEQLSQQGLCSEQRFAQQLARARTGRGYGPRRIAAELAQHNLSSECIAAAIAEAQAAADVPQDWVHAALQAAQRHFRQCPDTPQHVQRVVRYLYQRGYSAETAQCAVRAWQVSRGGDVQEGASRTDFPAL
jgi:regulatory protein